MKKITLILAFLATRLLALRSAGSLWFDEAFSVTVSSLPLRQMFALLRFEHNPLLPFLLLKGWMNVIGSSDVLVRLPSLVAGVASVALIYALGKKLFSESVGLWAGFFMTCSTIMLYHQTEARMYAFVVLFALTTLYGYVLMGENHRHGWWIYALSTLALVHTHITAWVLPLSLVLFTFLIWKQTKPTRQEVVRFMAINFFLAATVLVWAIPVAINKFAAGHVSQGWFFAQNTDGYFLTHLANALVNGESRLPLRSVATMLVVLLLLASFISVERPSWWQSVRHVFERDRWPLSLSVSWTPSIRLMLWCLIVPMLVGFAFQITVTKYLLVMMIPLFILMAEGATRLCKTRTNRAMLALGTILLVLPVHLRLYTEKRHHWDDVAANVERLHTAYPQAPIVIHSFSYALPLERYLPENIDVLPFYPLSDSLSFLERVTRYNWQGLVSRDQTDLFVTNVSQKQVILVSSTEQEDPLKTSLFSQGWRISEIFSWVGYGDPNVLLLEKR